jgi:hypothetical protein
LLSSKDPVPLTGYGVFVSVEQKLLHELSNGVESAHQNIWWNHETNYVEQGRRTR